MQTITIDILNEKAMQLIKNLELLRLIRLRRDKKEEISNTSWKQRYKGAMTKQPLTDIDTQLNDLRNEW